jgi:hypothetical protein
MQENTQQTIKFQLIENPESHVSRCIICGENAGKDGIICQIVGDEHKAVEICFECLRSGDLDGRLKKYIETSEENSLILRSFLGRIEVPCCEECEVKTAEIENKWKPSNDEMEEQANEHDDADLYYYHDITEKELEEHAAMDNWRNDGVRRSWGFEATKCDGDAPWNAFPEDTRISWGNCFRLTSRPYEVRVYVCKSATKEDATTLLTKIVGFINNCDNQFAKGTERDGFITEADEDVLS